MLQQVQPYQCCNGICSLVQAPLKSNSVIYVAFELERHGWIAKNTTPEYSVHFHRPRVELKARAFERRRRTGMREIDVIVHPHQYLKKNDQDQLICAQNLFYHNIYFISLTMST